MSKNRQQAATPPEQTKQEIAALPDDKPDGEPAQPPAAASTEIMTIAATETPIRGVLAKWNAAKTEYASNFDPKGQEGFSRRIKLLGAADKQLSDVVGTPFSVKWWFLHPVTLVHQEDGEEYEACRLVMMAPDGSTISTTSVPFIDRFGAVITEYGKGELAPHLVLTASRHKAKGPGFFLQLDSVRRGE